MRVKPTLVRREVPGKSTARPPLAAEAPAEHLRQSRRTQLRLAIRLEDTATVAIKGHFFDSLSFSSYDGMLPQDVETNERRIKRSRTSRGVGGGVLARGLDPVDFTNLDFCFSCSSGNDFLGQGLGQGVLYILRSDHAEFFHSPRLSDKSIS